MKRPMTADELVLKKYKREAHDMRKKLGYKTHEAYAVIAEEHGFAGWNEMRRALLVGAL